MSAIIRLAESSDRLSVTPPVCTEGGVTAAVTGGTLGEAAAAAALGFAVRATAGVARDASSGDGLETGLAAAAGSDEGPGVQTVVSSWTGAEAHPASSNAAQTHSAALRSLVSTISTGRGKVTTKISRG